MAFFRVSFRSVAVAILLVAFIAVHSLAQSPAPAPGPTSDRTSIGQGRAVHSPAQSPTSAPGPTSDGTSIDQGIAYLLMLVALVLTYLIHPLDATFSVFKFL